MFSSIVYGILNIVNKRLGKRRVKGNVTAIVARSEALIIHCIIKYHLEIFIATVLYLIIAVKNNITFSGCS